MIASLFRRSNDNHPERVEASWDELAEALTTHERRPEKEGPLWSPAEYPDGATRGNRNVTAVHALALDLDAVPDGAVEELRQNAAGLAWVLASSHSHRSQKKNGASCLRAVFALSRPVLPEEWPRFWDAAVALLGLSGVADPACRDLARAYYLPSAPDGAEVVSERHEGEPVDVEDVLAIAPRMPPGFAAAGTPAKRGRGRPRKDVAEPKSGPGARNLRLTREAGRLRAAGVSLEGLEAELVRRNPEVCDPPLDEDEVREIARSIANYAPRRSYYLTELGNAERLVDAHGDVFRWVHSWACWIVWDGRRWRREGAIESMSRLAKKVVRELHVEAASLLGDPAKEKLAKAVDLWARTSAKRAGLGNMVELAKSEPGISVSHEDLDRDPLSLCVRNGIVDLRTGELRPHAREELITKMAGCAYREDALSELWEWFLGAATQDDHDLQSYLQRVAGYAATADASEEALFFFYGGGINGKGTWVDAVKGALGEYAQAGAPNLLLAKKNEQHPTEVADLYKARMVDCQEVDEGRAWAEALVKQLTGGDEVSARRMHENFWRFRPTHKFVVSGNHKPRVKETTEGIWRRMRLVPFRADFRDRKDPTVKERLKSDGPDREAVLAWIVQGSVAWAEHGLGECAAVKEATEEYRAEQDDVGTYLDERCSVGGSGTVERGALYRDYTSWCQRVGITFPASSRRFNDRVREERGVREGRVGEGRTRGWLGIEIKKSGPQPQKN